MWSRSLRVGALAVVLVVSGCSSDASEESVGTGETEPRSAEIERANDFQTSVMSCLTERGWPVKLTDDGGGITYDGVDPGPEVGERYNQDLDACTLEAGPLPTYQPLSDAEIRAYFALNLEVAACLEAEGITVPEPPSEDVFVEAHRAAAVGTNVETWNPHAAVPPDQGPRMLEKCPEPTLEDLVG